MRLFSQSAAALLCFLICICSSSALNAQTSTKPKTSVQAKKDKKFAERFWNYLLTNNYKHWSPAPGKSADHFASQVVGGTGSSPHSANVKMYVNRTAASNPDSLPVGSVLILENYRQDKSLETISVMYRTPGFNPSANDWYWINYNPDGSVATEQPQGLISSVGHNGVSHASGAAPVPRKLVGRSQACIECHKSGGTDLAFFNNRLGTQTASVPPMFQQPVKEADSAFRKKLKVQPAAAFKQGSQQNFNIEIQPETVIISGET